MAQNQPIRETKPSSEIPDKLYFRIGDVAKLCEVPAYVLRFWETEFPQLKPNKGGTGQRLYRRRDVEMALRIKRLLYDEGYTIPGARQVFQSEQKGNRDQPQLALAIEPAAATAAQAGATDAGYAQKLQSLRKELQALCTMLSAPPTGGTGPARVQTIRARQPRTAHHLSFAVPAARPAMDDLFSQNSGSQMLDGPTDTPRGGRAGAAG
jgi:DNA-binding transcriptional MerR regulator